MSIRNILITMTVLSLAVLLASPAISDIASDIAGSVPLGFDQSLTFQITLITIGAGIGLGGVGALGDGGALAEGLGSGGGARSEGAEDPDRARHVILAVPPSRCQRLVPM